MPLIKKDKKISQDVALLIIGVLLLLFTIGAVIYFIGFLSNNIFSALAPGQDNGARIKFDLEGYKSLGLD
ncbi:MAG: hypothetical protein HYW00_01305 [Candidatus Colwellbacteria bacterium]|nr:hypothetical protein [Candidatus Colwellbacteria bacterium]